MRRLLVALFLTLVLPLTVAAEGRYLDRDAGFSLSPSDWQGNKVSQGNTALQLRSPDGTSVYTVMVIPDPDGMNAPQVESALYQQANSSGYKLMASQQVQVGRYAGGQVTYLGQGGAVERTTGVPLGGRIYLLQVASKSQASFEQNRGRFEQITASFQPELNRTGQQRMQQQLSTERREYRRRERLRQERLRTERLRRERDGRF